MDVRDIMTEDPACCTPDTELKDVARMMLKEDCGGIPVVKDTNSLMPIGMVTDRDIVARVIAKGQDPMQKKASDAMTQATLTIPPEADVSDAAQLMRDHQVRRLIVIDGRERCVGIVAQADLARAASERETGAVVEEISAPSAAASRPSRFQHQPEEHKPSKGGV